MKFLLLIGCILLISTGASAQTRRGVTIPADFKSDKCSLFPDCDYGDCCIEHDKEYYIGGSLKQRAAADKRLYTCVKAKGGRGHKMIAALMWVGIRVGAVSFLPTRFRWGFGNKYPRKEPKEDKRKDKPKPIGR
ncbi:MAG: hypothetical protein ABR530_06320 [Pyrinomonadaceae bacterium]